MAHPKALDVFEHGILDGLHESQYPHIFAFVRDASRSGSRASKCKTSIEALEISGRLSSQDATNDTEHTTPLGPGSKCTHLPSIPTSSLPSLLSPQLPSSTSIFLIIESPSLATISTLISLLDQSFLSCLNSFFNDSPSTSFLPSLAPHLPAFPSLASRERHIKFLFHQYRELERCPPQGLTYGGAQTVAAQAYWRCRPNYGLMEPCQRTDPSGARTEFPLVLVQRRHMAVWFGGYSTAAEVDGTDEVAKETWKLGVVLVDPVLDVGMGLGARLAEPLFPRVLGLNTPDSGMLASHKTCIGLVAKQLVDDYLTGCDSETTRPPLAVFMDSIYRVMAAEWVAVHTYCVRHINTIEWRLQGERGDGITTPQQFEQVHSALFWMRQRLKRGLEFARSQHKLCASGGPTPWTAFTSGSHEKRENSAEKDYAWVLSLLNDDFIRVQEVIEHVTSLSSIQQTRMGVEEARRSTEHNRLVLVLTFMATFFLPISTTAAILGMNGEWAPGEARFGQFWAIAMPSSLVLVGVMVWFMFSGQVARGLGIAWGSSGAEREESPAVIPTEKPVSESVTVKKGWRRVGLSKGSSALV